MLTPALLRRLAKEHGTPLFVVDHDDPAAELRARSSGCLPRVQAYYAVKANPDPAIVKTLYEAGASFDVASMPEFLIVYENIKSLPAKERQDFIWDKIIYANPIKANETLRGTRSLQAAGDLRQRGGGRQDSPLVAPCRPGAADSRAQYGGDGRALLEVRRRPRRGGRPDRRRPSTPAWWSRASASTSAARRPITTISPRPCNWPPGSSTRRGLRGFERLNILDIGGGFPAPYNETVRPFEELAHMLNAEFKRLFPRRIEILAEPGRFLVATAAAAVVKIIGAAVRDGKPCYYVDDGVYHTFSGIIFDHCQYHLRAFKKGPTTHLLGLRPDLRRPGHDLHRRGPPRARFGRFSLQRKHRRLQPRLVDLL